jgi:hypothetical protein
MGYPQVRESRKKQESGTDSHHNLGDIWVVLATAGCNSLFDQSTYFYVCIFFQSNCTCLQINWRIKLKDVVFAGKFHIPVTHHIKPASRNLEQVESINPLARPSRIAPLQKQINK